MARPSPQNAAHGAAEISASGPQARSVTLTDVCKHDGCTNPIRGRGWCITHYERWRRHGDPSITKSSTPGRQRPKGLPAWLDLDRLANTVPDEHWYRQAPCQGTPTALWFPDNGGYGVHPKAQALCDACPVRYDCLADTLDNEATGGAARGTRHGHYAATTGADRNRIAHALHRHRQRRGAA